MQRRLDLISELQVREITRGVIERPEVKSACTQN
ncbi:hypothetical protein BHMPCIPO_06414 [Ensifer sesbaniae]|nr:hypothetical protein [Ensifer sesbaniae]